MKREQYATLYMTTERDEPNQEKIRATLQGAGYKVNVASVAYVNPQQRELEFRLQWHGIPGVADAPSFLRDLASDPHVMAAQWKLS
jgi:hypothetical protein